MKPSHLLLAVTAVLASGACNAEKGNDAAASVEDSGKPIAVKSPANGDWSSSVTATSAGGYRMGNPNAKIHLIEYGSMTCPHCRSFDENGVTPLTEKYVKPGQPSHESRHYARHPRRT